MKKPYFSRPNISLVSSLFISMMILPFTWNGSGSCFAQDQHCLTIGGPGSDEGESIVQTKDGGYAISGQTNSYGAGGWDMYVTKLDPSGGVQWTRTIGGTGNEFGRSIVQTKDGGYAIAGSTNSFGAGGDDFYIVKLDGNGTVQWTRTVGGTGTDLGWEIVQTTDGGYAIAGQTSSFGGGPNDMYLVKLDGSGNLQWDNRIGKASIADLAYSLVQTADGGYALCGTTFTFTGNVSTSSVDYYIVKTDGSGNIVWSRVIVNPSAPDLYPDYARSIKQTADHGYIISGESGQPHSSGGYNYHILVVKLDSNGVVQWDKYFGGLNIPGFSIDNSDYGESVIQTTDGGYVIGGYTFSFNYDFSLSQGVGLEMYMLKLDSSGNLLWTKLLGGVQNDIGKCVVQTTDGGFAIAGYTQPKVSGQGSEDIYFVKLDSSAVTCCYSRTGGGYRGTGGTFSTAGSNFTAGGTSGVGGFIGTGGSFNNISTCVISGVPIAYFQSSDTAFCAEAGGCINFFDHSTGNPTSWQWFFPGATPDTSTAQNPAQICYSQPGTYAVTLIVSNALGSDTLAISPMITIGNTPPPPTLTLSHDTITCSHASYYQWYFNGGPIPGATDSFYVATQNGNYNVYITDEIGCSRLGNGILFTFINEWTSHSVGIYPNPTTGDFEIAFGITKYASAKIELINIVGEIVFNEEVKLNAGSNSYMVKPGVLAPGMYVLHIVRDGELFNQKVVIKK